MQTPSRSRLESTIAVTRSALRRAVDVEDAAALGVRQRANAVVGREARESRRRGAAAAQDHERNPAGNGDERLGSGAIGRAHEPNRAPRRCPLPPAPVAAPGRPASRPSRARRRPCGGRSCSGSSEPGPQCRAPPRASPRSWPRSSRRECAARAPSARSRASCSRSPARAARAPPSSRAGARASPRAARRDGAGRAPLRRASRAAASTSRSFAASTSPTRSSSNRAARRSAGPTAASLSDGSAAAAATASRSTSSRIVLYFVHFKQHNEGGHESRSASREVEGSGPTTPRQPASEQGANRPSSPLGSM